MPIIGNISKTTESSEAATDPAKEMAELHEFLEKMNLASKMLTEPAKTAKDLAQSS